MSERTGLRTVAPQGQLGQLDAEPTAADSHPNGPQG